VDVSSVATFTPLLTAWNNKDVGLVISTTATGLNASTLYYVRIRTYDGTGNVSSYSTTKSARTNADTTAPTAPTVTLVGGAQQVAINWTGATDTGGSGLTGYRVDVSSVATFTPLLTAWNNKDVGLVTSTTPTNLMANTTYYVRVRAYDGAANLSPYSTTKSATTSADTTAPTAPTVTLVGGAQQVTINWTGATDTGGSGLAGYRVDVSSVATFTPLLTAWNNKDVGLLVSTTATSLTVNTMYYVRVRAYDGAANLSPYSTTKFVTTSNDTTAPTAPTVTLVGGPSKWPSTGLGPRTPGAVVWPDTGWTSPAWRLLRPC